MSKLALVAGASGFIGGHLVKNLLASGWRVRAVGRRPLQSWEIFDGGAENLSLNLSDKYACIAACSGVSEVYNLAADVGGIEHIQKNKARCMLSSLINTHLLLAAKECGVKRYFYASSACVYPKDRDLVHLQERDAYPPSPEDGYGWEKLFGERMCRHFYEDFGLETRVARLHTVYGPCSPWNGGKEKVPMAMCRKVAVAVVNKQKDVEIWSDGEQRRTFTYIDDCIKGINLIMQSEVREPLNLGSSELVSVNTLTDYIFETAGVELRKRYIGGKPEGFRARGCDNTKIKSLIGWEPTISLKEGIKETYKWVYDQYTKHYSAWEIE